MVKVFTLVVAVSGAVDRREQAGTNYRSPQVRKGTCGPEYVAYVLVFRHSIIICRL